MYGLQVVMLQFRTWPVSALKVKIPVEYNQGSFNDLVLSLDNPSDQSKTPKDVPNCQSTFTNLVIDGCDGNDAANNYQNFKYGGIHTTTNGWIYTMEPKAIHVDKDSCDVSYKALLDEFEIRGKNFSDAELKQTALDYWRNFEDVVPSPTRLSISLQMIRPSNGMLMGNCRLGQELA